MMSAKPNRPAAVWVIINLIYTAPVFLLSILGCLLNIRIDVLSHPLLIFRLFYQGYFIELIFTLITFVILYTQICNFRKEHKPLSAPVVVGEVFVIVVNVLDHTPLLGTEQLYYTIPGW